MDHLKIETKRDKISRERREREPQVYEESRIIELLTVMRRHIGKHGGRHIGCLMRSKHQRIHWRFWLVQLQGLELRGEAFNGILQDTWTKVDYKRILNNEEQAVINFIHVQEGLVGGTKTITQGLGEED